ncbi:MAG: endonuclease III [Treponemataceae bacterium]|nr:endonuclease III [Treponemataceae bacterium]
MSAFRFLTEDEVCRVFEAFKAENPNPQTELLAPNEYTLLVAVVLSAQTTDKSVNKATRELFEKVTTPEQMLELGEEKLIQYIRSIGLYRAKASHVMALSKMLVEEFDSKLPSTREELMRLPGVGRKTANVVLNVVFGQPTMPVDTHILRIAPKIGLSDGTTPEQVERDLVAKIPACYMEHAHHWLILQGRYVCTARKPACMCEGGKCCIESICAKNGLA